MTFHCMDVPQFVYPFTTWGTSWLLSHFGTYEQSHYTRLCAGCCVVEMDFDWQPESLA